MSRQERDTRRRRRLLALLLLLLLAAVAAVLFIGRGSTHDPSTSDGAGVSEPTGSGAPAPTESNEAPSSPTSSLGRGRKGKKKKASPVHTGAPTTPAGGASRAGGTAGSPGTAGDDESSPSQVDNGPALPFTIAGNVRDLRAGAWTRIPTVVTNPNDVAIRITGLRVSVSGNPNGCDAVANFETRAGTESFTVPPGARGYPVPLAKRPWIRLRSLALNQNRCKRQTITLSFSGSATGS